MKHLSVDVTRYEVDGTDILRGLSCVINENDRIGMVGANGAGKTTFMKIITGDITAYDGSISNTGSMSLGYLSQIHFDAEDRNVKDELRLAYTDILRLEQELAYAEEHMDDENGVERYSEALEKFHVYGGYDYEREIDRVARGLGIFELIHSSIKEISGGQRTKVALAKVLLSRPDFLFLDEPTNFIDLASVEWLEEYLNETWKGGFMIISHDREFLDATCSIIYDVEKVRPLEIYHGNYSKYITEKYKREEKAAKVYEEQQEHLKSEKQLINRFRAGSRAGFAKSRERALEKVELIPPPLIPFRPTFLWNFTERPSDKIVYFKEAFIGRDEPLFYIPEVTFGAGHRIGIVGENGVGKSTFLKTILGKIPLLDGISSGGKWSDIVYYSQMHEELAFDKTLYENFELHGMGYTRERLAGLLGNYGFDYFDLEKPLFAFSGGQVSKILFAIIGQKPANVLILDEPTNHLDYDARESLERSLRHYKGAILFISHDRYFVNKLASHLWIIEDGELIISYGNYSDYRLKKERGIDFDMSLWQEDGELALVLEEKLGKNEARRIRDKFSRKWKD